MKDLIPGGLADNKSDKDFPKDQMRKGEKVEREHTSSKAIAKEIARDHLVEDKKYYDKLEKMEKKAFWVGFEKRAISRKLLGIAAQAAADARDVVKKVSKAEGLFPGPMAGKFDAQHNLFKRVQNIRNDLGKRKSIRLKNENKPMSGKYFKNTYKDILGKTKLNSQLALDLSKGKK